MNSVFFINPFIFALIICCQYYQNEENKSEHIFKESNAAVTLSSRVNRLLAESEAVPSTNPLSSCRRKKKESNAESQKGELEINLNENDIANLENFIKENMNNNNMINDNDDDDDDDDDDEIEFEEEGYSSNYRTFSKRKILENSYDKNPKYFLGINMKKIKKYIRNVNMRSGFFGAGAFTIGFPINQILHPGDKLAADYVTNYWLSFALYSYVTTFFYNVFFKTRKQNI
ncbi:Plasmodium exported protein, unknown function [Plasmodium chabaudi chabaudi]|uniref:Uncharacterized protein n=1 Tax=Plasmodium chabaudi chabaudi TaxID=31271 RepID=A0A4V0KAX0_PLACU|nr:Plasmodium exported protein, unknown function [Plasmodium chabaudi chabaudi]VTZ69956.1 Plasmodium exported protein, unknown function [Plasmodium chabaudi chabaudi]|eukprot:XP_016652898.1 Plasmodium exported protein, unknown function [Plasmodium chabaudi chabaudi]